MASFTCTLFSKVCGFICVSSVQENAMAVKITISAFFIRLCVLFRPKVFSISQSPLDLNQEMPPTRNNFSASLIIQWPFLFWRRG
jgi:hypothetical protein